MKEHIAISLHAPYVRVDVWPPIAPIYDPQAPPERGHILRFDVPTQAAQALQQLINVCGDPATALCLERQLRRIESMQAADFLCTCGRRAVPLGQSVCAACAAGGL